MASSTTQQTNALSTTHQVNAFLSELSDLRDVISSATTRGSHGVQDFLTGHSAVYAAFLTPSNNSGVTGAVAMSFDRSADTLTVAVDAHHLAPGEIHPQHIHGFANDTASHLPTLNQDLDRDGFIEDKEAEAAAGPVIQSLTRSGKVTDQELSSDFPRANSHGNLHFVKTYHFNTHDPAQASIFEELQDRLAGRAYEIHGMNVPAGEGQGTSGEVNGTGGYIEPLPAAGGILRPISHTAVAQVLSSHFLL